jgi:hypothetical protein
VLSTYGKRTPQPGPISPQPTTQLMSNIQPPRMFKNKRTIIVRFSFYLEGKVKVKLQRIPPGTKWKQAKIDVIDSLSAFYVENLDPKVRQKFSTMLEDLQ